MRAPRDWVDTGAAGAILVEGTRTAIGQQRPTDAAHACARRAVSVGCAIGTIRQRRSTCVRTADGRWCTLEIEGAEGSVRRHRRAAPGAFVAILSGVARSGTAARRTAGARPQQTVRAFAEHVEATARRAELAGSGSDLVTRWQGDVHLRVVEQRGARGRLHLVQTPPRGLAVVGDRIALCDEIVHAGSDASLHRPALSVVDVEKLHSFRGIATGGDLRADDRGLLGRPARQRYDGWIGNDARPGSRRPAQATTDLIRAASSSPSPSPRSTKIPPKRRHVHSRNRATPRAWKVR